jgi:hypothetical protein
MLLIFFINLVKLMNSTEGVLFWFSSLNLTVPAISSILISSYSARNSLNIKLKVELGEPWACQPEVCNPWAVSDYVLTGLFTESRLVCDVNCVVVLAGARGGLAHAFSSFCPDTTAWGSRSARASPEQTFQSICCHLTWPSSSYLPTVSSNALPLPPSKNFE